jgi:hypothetical protein
VPAVDYVEIAYKEGSIRIWMCAPHWDEHQKSTQEGKTK